MPGYSKNDYRIELQNFVFFKFLASNENERCLVHRPSIVTQHKSLLHFVKKKDLKRAFLRKYITYLLVSVQLLVYLLPILSH